MTAAMRQGVLAHAIDRRPEAADFRIVETELPACPEKGLVIELHWISLDPFVGTRIRGKHLGEPAPEPGRDAIPAYGVGVVVESRSPGFREGDWVHSAEAGWREYAAVSAASTRRIDVPAFPAHLWLGVLGMPGLTAWAAMASRAKVHEGDVVTLDAAAGAVGGAASQIARARGASRVVGIAGGPEKCAIATGSYWFDACVDYKREGWQQDFTAATPDGISVHLENVSTDIANLALSRLRNYGRLILCGLAGEYHAAERPPGIVPGLVVGKRAEVMGLIVYDYFDRWDAFLDEAKDWVREGRLKIAEDRADGLDGAPALFERLMRGDNRGKALVRLKP